MAEYDPKRQRFFGYTIPHGDYSKADWGYTNLEELVSMDIRGIEVECDVSWEPTRFWNIEGVRKGFQYKWLE